MTVSTSGRAAPSPARTSRVTKRIVVTIIAVLALSILVPSMASAASGNWKGWGYLPITESTSAEWGGKLKVVDSEYVFSGKTYKLAVECSDTVNSTLKVNGMGEITGIATSGCVGSENCGKEGAKIKIAAVNLPWQTELALEGTFLNRIVNGGKGTPGFEIECKLFGIGITDTCTGNLKFDITKLDGVTGAFDNHKTLTCTLSEKVSGFAEGAQSISGIEGVEEPAPTWAEGTSSITTEKAVEWSKGKLTLWDATVGSGGAHLSVTCEEGGAGTVGAAGSGSLTNITTTKCEQGPNSECKGAYAIEALHLPWNTNLFFGRGEVMSNAIASGTGGVPAFKLACEVSGIRIETQCEASSSNDRLATTLADVEGGVSAEYYDQFNVLEPTYLKCSTGSGEGSELLESKHTIKLTGSGTLRVVG